MKHKLSSNDENKYLYLELPVCFYICSGYEVEQNLQVEVQPKIDSVLWLLKI